MARPQGKHGARQPRDGQGSGVSQVTAVSDVHRVGGHTKDGTVAGCDDGDGGGVHAREIAGDGSALRSSPDSVKQCLTHPCGGIAAAALARRPPRSHSERVT
ncbi:hypothetical protein GCM10020000_29490 [Streptomyces olivoverticillatus]